MENATRNGGGRARGVLAVGLLLSGCSALPLDGPTPHALEQEAKRNQTADGQLLAGHALFVPGSPAVIAVAEAQPGPAPGAMPDGGGTADRIGAGDVLGISVIENGPAGLFSTATASATASAAAQAPSGARMTTLPDLVVAQDGSIVFPYLGRVAVAGSTAGELSLRLQHLLSAQTMEPQVLVSLRGEAAHVVVVGGSVGHPGEAPIPARGERILEAVARAGGSTIDPASARIRLVRDGVAYEQNVSTLLSDARTDVPVRNGDYIDVSSHPRRILVLGAVGQSHTLPLPLDRLSLTEVVATSAGLDDFRADPRGVYVMRRLPVAVARRMVAVAAQDRGEAAGGTANAGNGADAPPPGLPRTVPASAADGDGIDVVMQFDFNSAAGMFHGQRFTMRDADIVYVGNARATQWQKFMNLFTGVTAPAAIAGRAAAT